MELLFLYNRSQDANNEGVSPTRHHIRRPSGNGLAGMSLVSLHVDLQGTSAAVCKIKHRHRSCRSSSQILLRLLRPQVRGPAMKTTSATYPAAPGAAQLAALRHPSFEHLWLSAPHPQTRGCVSQSREGIFVGLDGMPERSSAPLCRDTHIAGSGRRSPFPSIQTIKANLASIHLSLNQPWRLTEPTASTAMDRPLSVAWTSS